MRWWYLLGSMLSVFKLIFKLSVVFSILVSCASVYEFKSDSVNAEWLVTANGCKVYWGDKTFLFIEGGYELTWSGDCNDGFANGYGVAILEERTTQGKYFVSSYRGDVERGKFNGNGVFIDFIKNTRAVYVGGWRSGRYDGIGVFFTARTGHSCFDDEKIYEGLPPECFIEKSNIEISEW